MGEVELHTLVNRRLRSGLLTASSAQSGLADFDGFLSDKAQTLPLSAPIGELAIDLARDPLLKLSAAYALHLAAAAHGGHVLVSFDIRLTDAAFARTYLFEIP